MRKSVFGIFLACLSVSLLASVYRLPDVGSSTGSGDSWLTGWNYRESHVINSTPYAGTDYQVKINVHYGSGLSDGQNVYCDNHSQGDFGDVRFTDESGVSLLSYWRGNYTPYDTAVFWVKISGNLSESDQAIYMYYGNSSVSTTSDFDNTFIFGDPFDNSTLDTSRWTSVDAVTVYSINTMEHYVEVTSTNPNWFNGAGFHSKNLSMPTSWIVQDAYSEEGFLMYHNPNVVGDVFGQALILRNTTVESDVWQKWPACSRIVDAWAGDNGVGDVANVGSNDWIQSWFPSLPYTPRWTMAKYPNATISISLDGSKKISATSYDTIYEITWEAARYPEYSFGVERLYAFIVRKFAGVEPSQDSWGNEETPPLIVSVLRDPEAPNYSQQVNVTAEIVTSNSPLDRAILAYCVSSDWNNMTMMWLAGDTYSAIIPGEPYGTYVQYKVLANDTDGNWTESSIFLYTVGDFTAPDISNVELAPTCPYPYVPSNLTRVREATLVTVNASEPSGASGVAYVEIAYSIEDEYCWNTTLRLNATSGLYYCVIPAQPESCNITFTVKVTDFAGNTETTTQFSYTVKDVSVFDLNGDCKIDVKDIASIARHFGEHNP